MSDSGLLLGGVDKEDVDTYNRIEERAKKGYMDALKGSVQFNFVASLAGFVLGSSFNVVAANVSNMSVGNLFIPLGLTMASSVAFTLYIVKRYFDMKKEDKERRYPVMQKRATGAILGSCATTLAIGGAGTLLLTMA